VYAKYDEPYFAITFEPQERLEYEWYLRQTPRQISVREEAARQEATAARKAQGSGVFLHECVLPAPRRKAKGRVTDFW
jgi:hypothetical protein